MEDIDLFARFRSREDELEETIQPENSSEKGPLAVSQERFHAVIKEKQSELQSKRRKISGDIEKPFQPSHVVADTLYAPWVVGQLSGHAWVDLHREIIEFVDYIRPTGAEVAIRLHILEKITDLCTGLWPDCHTQPFGSMMTELLLPKSDIDVCVTHAPDGAMSVLAQELELKNLIEVGTLRVIENAKVPIIKFMFRGTPYTVDVGFNTTDGFRTTKKLSDLIDQYPMAYPLIMVVKMFLFVRKLHEPFLGGMGSYAVSLLVVNFLQNHPYRELPEALRRKVSLGILLAEFFKVVGFYFNFPHVGVSLGDGGFYFKKCEGETRGALIVDPICRDNNVTSAARHFPSVVRSFQNAFISLRMDDSFEIEKLPQVTTKNSLSEKPCQSNSILQRILWVPHDMLAMRGNAEECLKNLKNNSGV